jgi:hypothetical protein
MESKTSLKEKVVTYFKSSKWKILWDKITTGILIALMITPFAILTYIILWFTLK